MDMPKWTKNSKVFGEMGVVKKGGKQSKLENRGFDGTFVGHEDETDGAVFRMHNPSTGKTSLLNAILRRYYGVGPTDPLPMTNIMVVNTLKEQGIQYFRNEMKTFCQSRSTVKGRKKMLVIDDIDNISDQCQHHRSPDQRVAQADCLVVVDGDEGVEHPQVGCLADGAYAESQLDAKSQRRLGVVNAHG